MTKTRHWRAKPWAVAGATEAIGRLHERVPDHPTLTVFAGDTVSTKQAEAIALANAEGTLSLLGSGHWSVVFALRDWKSLQRLRDLVAIVGRWRHTRFRLGTGHDLSVHVLRDALMGVDIVPDRGSFLSRFVATLGCLEAVTSTLDETTLPELTKASIQALALGALQRRAQTPDARRRALATIQSAIQAALWLCKTSAPRIEPDERSAEVLGCFAAYAIANDEKHYCRGGRSVIQYAARDGRSPFPCLLHRTAPTPQLPYDPAKPTLVALRTTAQAFHANWCPAFSIEPSVPDVRTARAQRKERDLEAQSRQDDRPGLSMHEMVRSQRVAMARIEANQEAADNLNSFISGAGLHCQGCGVLLDRKYLLQALRVKREAGGTAAKLVQTYAKVIQAVTNRLCIECSPLTLRKRCRVCGNESPVGDEPALAAALAEAAETSTAKAFDVSEWAAKNANAIAIAVLGVCAECPREHAR